MRSNSNNNRTDSKKNIIYISNRKKDHIIINTTYDKKNIKKKRILPGFTLNIFEEDIDTRYLPYIRRDTQNNAGNIDCPIKNMNKKLQTTNFRTPELTYKDALLNDVIESIPSTPNKSELSDVSDASIISEMSQNKDCFTKSNNNLVQKNEEYQKTQKIQKAQETNANISNIKIENTVNNSITINTINNSMNTINNKNEKELKPANITNVTNITNSKNKNKRFQMRSNKMHANARVADVFIDDYSHYKSASIFCYRMTKDGKKEYLVGFESRRGWSDFGGCREYAEKDPIQTAMREFMEETKQMLKLSTNLRILCYRKRHVAFIGQLSGIVPSITILKNTKRTKHSEKTDYAWIVATDLIKALDFYHPKEVLWVRAKNDKKYKLIFLIKVMADTLRSLERNLLL